MPSRVRTIPSGSRREKPDLRKTKTDFGRDEEGEGWLERQNNIDYFTCSTLMNVESD